MSMNRRDFLKTTLAGGALLASSSEPASARENLKMPENALGLLYDSTLCIGCRACMPACKAANNMPPELNELQAGNYWDAPLDLSGKTLNVIKMWKDGKGENKNQEQDGFAFMKFSCLQCVDPSCVSACPVSAMKKDPATGIVTYDKDACIGCRYCVAACPFNVPRFEYDQPFPKISKCQLCAHRLKEGKYAACAEVCPTGATLYGKVSDLKKEIARRKTLKPGEETVFPRGHIGGTDKYIGKAAKYVAQVYGENENGGTQVLRLSSVPFEKMGFAKLPERSYASMSEGMQHGIYNYLIAPLAVLGGLAVIAKRNIKDDEE